MTVNLLCTDNSSNQEFLTVGNVYAPTGYSPSGMLVNLIADNGKELSFFSNRFSETLEEPTPVHIEEDRYND